MKARNLMVCAGLPLCLAVAAASAQQFQTAQAITTQGEQYRMAPLTVVDGQWMLGEFGPWRNHDDQISGRTLGNTPAIDAYEYDYLGDPRTPLGGDLCATTYAPSTRFFLGTTVTNPHYCNDFSLTRPETFGKRVVLFGHTLWWNPPATEPCFIVVRFWDDYNNAGEGTINPTTTGFNVGTGDAILAAKNGLGGFAVELRSSATAPGLTATSAGYRTRYYNFKNEPGIVANMPMDGTGATEMIIANSLNGFTFGTAPNQPPPGGNYAAPVPGPLSYTPATGPAQSMYWSMDNRDNNPSTPRRPGDELSCTMWMEDDQPFTTNGTFVWNAPTTGLKNDFFGFGCGTTPWFPCGHVAGFMYYVVVDETATPCPGTGGGACSRADWNEDGVIDFNDFLSFLNTFNAQDLCADLNGDGVVDFNDFLEFLNLYNAGC
ncbi:MAG: EF-hand domain-containing protein [Phycisphaerae bacterium]|nr:EF-hand domain-containing protein [Phycisphaerae bacterium]